MGNESGCLIFIVLRRTSLQVPSLGIWKLEERDKNIAAGGEHQERVTGVAADHSNNAKGMSLLLEKGLEIFSLSLTRAHIYGATLAWLHLADN